jgi:hypothetical protein
MALSKRTTGTVLLLLIGLVASARPAPAEEKDELEKTKDQLKPLVRRLGTLSADLARAKKTDTEVADALFAATLVRLPTEAERATATKHLQQAKDRTAACRDLAWSLLNTKEFLTVHNLDGKFAEALHALNALSDELDARPDPDKPGPKDPPAKQP